MNEFLGGFFNNQAGEEILNSLLGRIFLACLRLSGSVVTQRLQHLQDVLKDGDEVEVSAIVTRISVFLLLKEGIA